MKSVRNRDLRPRKFRVPVNKRSRGCRQVSDLLDRLYTSFDALSEEHDVFKVASPLPSFYIAEGLAAGTRLVGPNAYDDMDNLGDSSSTVFARQMG